jgi:hypothetical protein
MKESMKKTSRRFAKASARKSPPRSITAGEDHTQQALDEALRETFPASDPIAVNIAKPVVQGPSGTTQREKSST